MITKIDSHILRHIYDSGRVNHFDNSLNIKPIYGYYGTNYGLVDEKGEDLDLGMVSHRSPELVKYFWNLYKDVVNEMFDGRTDYQEEAKSRVSTWLEKFRKKNKNY